MSLANEALMSFIRSRLANDSRLAALAIDVCCSEGFVSLIGRVDSAYQKRLAVELVSGLTGVRNVADQLEVIHPDATAPRAA
jgi:osmotically-inducible protein OsmY